MPDKPTYEELSQFGQCVIDTGIRGALEELHKGMAEIGHAPVTPVTTQEVARTRTDVLETIGIDKFMAIHPDEVEVCTPKLPKNATSLHSAARTTKI